MVDAGGSFGLLVHSRDDAPELHDLHRFTHAWEKTTSLQLRHGRSEAIDTLIEHDRITGGEAETMIDAAYTAWQRDLAAGRAPVLVAETHETVTTLNGRARADRIIGGQVNSALRPPCITAPRPLKVIWSSPATTTAASATAEHGSAMAPAGPLLPYARTDRSASARPPAGSAAGSSYLPTM
ncbi:hypothetical protein GCM10007061_10770 [Kocuria marina]|nr:hypothetical protein GCM10007061_10770 [Kocuria marina]